jgi:uncharacterized protein YcbX
MLINLQLLCTKKNVGSATCLPDVYPVIMGMACSVSDVHFLPSGFHIQLQREFLNRRPSFYSHLFPNLAVITAPGMDPLKIPLAAECETIDDVSVWEWSGSAYDEGAEAAEWFSAYFEKPSRLVRFKEGTKLNISMQW